MIGVNTAVSATQQVLNPWCLGEAAILLPVEASNMTDRVAELLHEAAETHHVVYRISDGGDPDWASWYADWLLDLTWRKAGIR